MVYYSDPVTPVVTKALVLPDSSDPTNPLVVVNASASQAPNEGSMGNTQTITDNHPRQKRIGWGHGSAGYTAPTGTPLLAADCENVAAEIGNQVAAPDYAPSSGSNMTYSFTVNADLMGGAANGGSVSGNGTVPAWLLPAWPEAQYGANLENRPTSYDGSGGPWNPWRDDPNAAPPATATDWEVVEPGHLVSAYLVHWSTTAGDDISDPTVAAYITLANGVQQGNFNASTAQFETVGVERPMLAEWAMPDQGSYWVWQTVSLDPNALPQTAYVLNNIYRQAPGHEPAWQWRFDPDQRLGANYLASVDLTVVYMWQPPTYRWVLSEAPVTKRRTAPNRILQRGSDGLSITGGRRIVQNRTLQSTNRRGAAIR